MLSATRLTLLNTSILTSFGTYRYEPVSRNKSDEIAKAKDLVAGFARERKPILSAIGHQATADLLSVLLDYPVELNRMEFKQAVDDLGLVFKLKGRAPEGAVLTFAEIEAVGYEFGLLRRLA